MNMPKAIVLLGFVGLAWLTSECGVQAASRPELLERAHKLLDFEKYKERFGKMYKSKVEEAARMKMFFARLHEAFISVIDFAFGKSSYFKAINSMSDWYEYELKALGMKLRRSKATRTATHRQAPKLEVQPTALDRSERSRGLAREPAVGEQRERVEKTGGIVRPDFDTKQAFDRQGVDLNTPNCVVEFSSLVRSPLSQSLGQEQSLRDSAEPPDKQAPRRNYTAEPDFKEIVIRPGSSRIKHSYDHLPNKGRQSLVEKIAHQLRDSIFHSESPPDVVWVDHRQHGCFGPIQRQKLCGSCYALAGTAYMQWLHCNQTGEMLEFSPQYIVDCGERLSEQLYGCDGGYPEGVAEFIANFGLELAAAYPYLDRKGNCPYSPDTPIKKLGYMKADVEEFVMTDPEYMEDLLIFTPLLVDINTKGDMHAYGGGVYGGEKCETEIMHELILVGHGRSDGEEYWILRNVWGEDWGEAGHMKLNKNSICIRKAYRYNFSRPPVNVRRNPDVAKEITPADVCPVKKT
jgi:hypothetical protein